MKKILKILIIILFFILPFINSHLLNYLGVTTGDIFLGWEFPKTLFFLIFSGIISVLFLFYLFKNKLKYNYIIVYLFLIFALLSSLLSSFPLDSIFSIAPKGHGFLIFSALSILFIIINEIKSKNFINNLFLGSSFSLVLSNIFGILNYFYNFTQATELANRNFATFGHPNYLALFILILLPLWLNNYFKNKFKLNLFFIIFNFVALLLAKSYLAIFLFILYFTYYLIKFYKINIKYFYYFLVSFIGFGIIILSLDISKANSFISRFFIWQASLEVIFSDIKNIIFGIGFENLSEFIVNYKNKMLYIFENFGYFPDRPHNIFLLIFSNLGLIGLSFFSYLIYKIFKNREEVIYKSSFIIAVLFLCFNFASIASYLLLIIIIVKLVNINKLENKKYLINKAGISVILIISLLGGISGIMAYYSKIEEEKGNYKLAYKIYPVNLKNKYYSNNFEIKNNFIEKNKSLDYYLARLNYSPDEEIIKEFLKNYYSVESIIFVGDVLYNVGNKTEAIKYYKAGLNKLDNLINSENMFDFLITKERLDGAKRRLYSERYGLDKVLEKIKTAP